MAKVLRKVLPIALTIGGSILGGPLGAALGATVAAGINSTLLKPKSSVSQSPQAEDRLSANIDPRTPRKMIFGKTAMATDIRDQEYTNNDSYLHRFVVVASHKVHAIREIWFDDKLAWSQTGGVTSHYAGYLDLDICLEGTAAEAVNISARMGATRRYTGLAYVYFRYKLTGNSKKAESPFAQSIPSRITIIGDGAYYYDPRLDSTVPGGSGSCRADDQSTWIWSDTVCRNAALGLLWYMLGWRINGRLAVGKGIPAKRIDMASFITAANLCDEPVTLAAGGTEPRYRADGIFSEGDQTSTVLEQFKATMNAEVDDVDGKLRIMVYHNDLATPIADFTEDDVLGPFQWDQTASLDESFNVVRGTYIDPSNNALFQAVDYPEVRVASADDIDRVEPVDLQLVQSASQAQRLGKQRVARTQYSGRFRASFSHAAWKVQKGDVVRFSFSPLGFTNKLFRVVETGVQVNGTVPMVLRVEHANVYLWDSDDRAAIAPVAPTTYDPYLNPMYQDATNPTYADGTPIDNLKPAEPGATAGASPSEAALLAQLDIDTAAAQAAIVAAQDNIAAIFQEIDDLDEALGNISVTVTQAGGNLAPNPDFGIDSAGWSFAQSGTSHSGARDLAGDAWRPVNEHNLGLYQSNNNSSDYAYWQTAKIAVAANSWQEFSAYVANHRCNVTLLMRFWPADGGSNIDYYSTATTIEHSGGTLDGHQRLVVKRQMPNARGSVELYFIKNGTYAGNDSYAWLLRPQLVETTADSVSPVRYYPGSATATVRQQATAIAGVVAQGAALEASLAVAGADIEDIRNVATTTAGDVAQLKVQVRAGNPNLIRSFENGLGGWNTFGGPWYSSGGGWGRIIYAYDTAGLNGFHYAYSEITDLGAPAEITLTADAEAYPSTGGSAQMYVQLNWYDGAGNYLASNYGPSIYGPVGFNAAGANREALKLTATGPAATRKFQVLLVANLSNCISVNWRQPKAEVGPVATAFSSEASAGQAFTALNTLNNQYASVSTTVQIQGVTITEQTDAIATQNGQINTLFGRWSAVIDVAGYVTSLEANNNGSTSAWKFRTNELTIEDPGGGGFQLANGRIRITAGGGYMKVTGDGFGSAGQFIDWYGPFFSNLSNCTEANAISYQTVDGRAYHGGGLSSGILKNEATSTVQSPTASIVVGPFSSNGDPISVNFSAGYSWRQLCDGSTGSISGVGGGTLTLEYLAGGGSWTPLATIGVNENQRMVITDGDPGVPDVIQWSMAAAGTASWTPGASASLVLRARWSNFSTPDFSGSNLQVPIIYQNTTLIAVET